MINSLYFTPNALRKLILKIVSVLRGINSIVLLIIYVISVDLISNSYHKRVTSINLHKVLHIFSNAHQLLNLIIT